MRDQFARESSIGGNMTSTGRKEPMDVWIEMTVRTERVRRSAEGSTHE